MRKILIAAALLIATVANADLASFRQQVAACWSFDPTCPAASAVVTVEFSLDPDGHVIGDDVRLIMAEGGSAAAQDLAFAIARRAVLRCQGDGYDLPASTPDQRNNLQVIFAGPGQEAGS